MEVLNLIRLLWGGFSLHKPFSNRWGFLHLDGPTSYQISPSQNWTHQVVRAMLESSMKERQTQRIQLNDTPREAVSLLLETLLLGLECLNVCCFLKKPSLFESKVEKRELSVYLPLSGVKHVMVGAEISVDIQTSDQYSGWLNSSLHSMSLKRIQKKVFARRRHKY